MFKGFVCAGLVLVAGQVGAQVAPSAAPAAAPAVVAPAAVKANPAMWKVQGEHETVYLFGTVHVMKPGVVWQTPKVAEAFKKSDTLYVEVAKVDDPASMQPLVMELGMDKDHPLSTVISKEDVALLDAAVKGMGFPGEVAMEPMKPWLAYMTLSVLPMLKAGYDPASGVDVKLTGDAKDSSKKIVGFETADQQLHYFADFPVPEQVALLHQELIDLPKSGAQMEEIIGSWGAGGRGQDRRDGKWGVSGEVSGALQEAGGGTECSLCG